MINVKVEAGKISSINKKNMLNSMLGGKEVVKKSFLEVNSELDLEMKVTFPRRRGRKGVRGKARVAKLPSSEIRSHFLRGVSRLLGNGKG